MSWLILLGNTDNMIYKKILINKGNSINNKNRDYMSQTRPLNSIKKYISKKLTVNFNKIF